MYMEYYSVSQDISFFLFLKSVVSKPHWLDEHAGSVRRPWCWDMCCISGADCRDLMETTREEIVDKNQVCHWATTSGTQGSHIQIFGKPFIVAIGLLAT